MQVDKVLQEIMAREGLSFTDVSKKLGMTRTYISTILKKGSIKYETVERICDACGYDVVVKAVSRIDGFEFDLN